MAKFASTYNGFVIEFKNEHDIAELRKHEGYVEVFEDSEEITDMVTKKKPAPMPMKEKDMPMKKKGKKGC